MTKGEQETFNLKPIIEQTPFDSLSAQAFLRKWGEINDGMKIQFLEREKWAEKKEKGSFREKTTGGMTLFLPKDLHLWEMVGVMEEIDKDTFAENPKKSEGKKAEMESLGKMFKNVGTYIRERSRSIKEGEGIAEAMADEFYSYGKLLAGGEGDDIADLSPEETEEAEKWLFGENIAASRMGSIEDEEKKEEERRETLAQFFRIADKAFVLQNRELSELKEKATPWDDTTPIHSAFLKKVEQSIQEEAEKPKWEIDSAIFRRGMENLLKNLERPTSKELVCLAEVYMEKLFGKKTTASFFGAQEKLIEALHFSTLKKEMNEVRESGDIASIGLKESEIALKIQRAVRSFPYRSNANNPSDIIEKKYINCVGASTLGGALLSEAGINYLVGAVPEHSLLFLVTADGKVIWHDMLSPDANEELSDDMLEGVNEEGKPLTVADIVSFSKNPKIGGLMFDIKGIKYIKKLPQVEEGQRQYITLFPPEVGQQVQLLSNTTSAFIKLKKYKEAIETSKQALAFSPKHLLLYNNLGYALLRSGRDEEAIIEYKKALALNPQFSLAYDGIGEALLGLDDVSGAKETFEKAISVHPTDSYAHLGLGLSLVRLGGFDNAAENEFKEAISLKPDRPDPYLHLSKLLKKMGKIEESELAYEDYLLRSK